MTKLPVGILLLFISSYSAADTLLPIANINIDNTQGAAVEIGGILAFGNDSGLTLSAEPGAAGTKIHIGYGGFYVEDGFASARLTLTQLKVSKNFNKVSKDEKYTGVELFFEVMGLATQIGYLKQSGGGSGITTFGIGFGI